MPFPEVCIVDRESCPNNWPFVRFKQLTKGEVTVALKNSLGKVVDLSNIAKVCFIAKEHWESNEYYINVEAEIVNALEGEIKITLSQDDLPDAGTYLGEFVLFGGVTNSSSSSDSSSSGGALIADDEVCDRYSAYLHVAESLQDLKNAGNKGLRVAEIRMALMDRCPNDNFLLDNIEFDDAQISWAIRRPIDYWNETNPHMRRHTYTPSNFPWRYHWVDGVLGELFKAAAYNYSRNNLRYSASGLSVDDKDKAREYMQFGEDKLQGYREWVQQTKIALNMKQAWGTTYIPVFGSITGAYRGRGSSTV